MDESSEAGHRRPVNPLSAFASLALLVVLSCTAYRSATPVPPLVLAADDRILVLAPHPDDEVLGAGGLLQAATARGLPVKVLFLTHGDANEWSFLAARKRPTLRPAIALEMGERRRREALEATARLGVPPEDVVFLGYPDKRILSIWIRHWGESPSRRGALTRAKEVPYPTALRLGAAHRGEEILADLRHQIEGFRPTKVFVSHPADRHGDHAALYLFTRAALWELEGELSPTLHPYLVHYPRWPGSKGFHPHRGLDPPSSLKRMAAWSSWPLEAEEVMTKRHALRAHETQYDYSARRLLPLVRANELFGDLPPVRLTALGVAADIEDDSEAFDEALEEPWEDAWQDPPRSRLGDSAPSLDSNGASAGVDLQRLTLHLEADALVVSAQMARPPSSGESLQLFLAGHRPGTPFAAMPKLEVRVGSTRHSLFDGGSRLPAAAVGVTREASRVTVRVPLVELGSPDRLLLGARLASERGQDRLPWRVVELR